MKVQIVESDNQLKDAFTVRKKVFIEEQQVPADLEMDEHDHTTATHFIGYDDELPIAAGRLRILDEYGKLERICVLRDLRGKSYGKQMIEQMEHHLKSNGVSKAKLNAQTHALKFYRSLGYEQVSEEFMDAGIPHVTMVKSL
ncbi:GNAT family N-acetyltransferase [Thalassobacillus hwangdonensis]|uniref:GNAT family N-acetyltransferase n=1 Tax=Thalassobacillus hwangdonensis TaxID=546108 RepID=A0ABW3KY59_9BACI